jgi:hypothetical protein
MDLQPPKAEENGARSIKWIKIAMVNCHVGNIQLSLCPSCIGADAPLDVWLSALSVCVCVCVYNSVTTGAHRGQFQGSIQTVADFPTV